MSLRDELPVVIGEEVYHKSRGKGTVSKIERNKGYFYVLFTDHDPKCFKIESFNYFFRTKDSHKIFLKEKKKSKAKKKIKNKKIKSNKIIKKKKESETKKKKSAYKSLTKEEKDKIISFIENSIDPSSEFKFDGFYHMTTLNNFILIAKKKMLVSRNRAIMIDDMSQKNYITNKIIAKTSNTIKNYVRFYFRPKTPTYYHFERLEEEYCLLKFDRDIMFNEYAKISRGNAAKRSNDLRDVRYNEIIDMNFRLTFLRSGNVCTHEELDLRDSELLIPHYVMIENVREYIFRNEINKMKVYKELKKRNIKLPRGGKFVVDSSKFIKNGG